MLGFMFCKSAAKAETVPPFTTPESARTVFFRSIGATGPDWEAAAPPDNLFLQRPFLSAVEQCPPMGISLGYLIFYKGMRPVGVAVLQGLAFKGSDQLDASLDVPTLGWNRKLKRVVASCIDFFTLICGTLLATGEHAYWFDPKWVAPDEQPVLLHAGLAVARRQWPTQGSAPTVTMIKDVSPERKPEGLFFAQQRYAPFEIQPNMTLALPYANMEEYLGHMSTKYRTRAKRAFKKAQGIERRELLETDLQAAQARMYELYRSVATAAEFNLVTLQPTYFLTLKRVLGEQFRVFGYYKDGQLVAFYTVLFNYRCLEAHFLGYDKALNHDMQLYLNMLYDMVRLGIEGGFSEMIFARTALEIKSSVGAVPQQLLCYLQHHSAWLNPLAGCIIEYVKPVEEWVQRHPFKTEEPIEVNS